jgi:pimeloyl-ACP methyl ester carboxylesterase
MPTYSAPDGTRLAYHLVGQGEPVICLPGGPMQSSAYLGDLGGLAAHRSLILLDLRGTGESAAPQDPTSYRCDRLVDDVEALREHLGRDRIDLLGHSAGAAVALLYAARYGERIDHLALVNPSPRVVNLDITDEDRREIVEQRRQEPWFPDAHAAFERIWSDHAEAEDWTAISPFYYGRWDADTARYDAEQRDQKNTEAAAMYYEPGGPSPEQTRFAIAELTAPVLLLTGEYDVGLPPKRAGAYARLFGRAAVAVQPGGGHFPWHDDREWFARTVVSFLDH